MPRIAAYWSASWLWSVPLILFTVLIHAFGLSLIRDRIVTALQPSEQDCQSRLCFAVVLGTTVLLVTFLHAFEGALWALAYLLLGALPDAPTAMLYSLEAMTTYGHANILLEPHWQMMGALEALNGMILFGLTTAFLFSILQSVSPRDKDRHWLQREILGVIGTRTASVIQNGGPTHSAREQRHDRDGRQFRTD